MPMGNKQFLKFLSESLSEQDASNLLQSAGAAYTIGTTEYARIGSNYVDAGGNIYSPTGVPRITRVRILGDEERKGWGTDAKAGGAKTPTGSIPSRVAHPIDNPDAASLVSVNAVRHTANGDFHDPAENANIVAREYPKRLAEAHRHEEEKELETPKVLGPEGEHYDPENPDGTSLEQRRIHSKTGHGQETTPSGVGKIHMTSAEDQPEERKAHEGQETIPSGIDSILAEEQPGEEERKVHEGEHPGQETTPSGIGGIHMTSAEEQPSASA